MILVDWFMVLFSYLARSVFVRPKQKMQNTNGENKKESLTTLCSHSVNCQPCKGCDLPKLPRWLSLQTPMVELNSGRRPVASWKQMPAVSGGTNASHHGLEDGDHGLTLEDGAAPALEEHRR